MNFEQLKEIYIEDKISRNTNKGSTLKSLQKELASYNFSNNIYKLSLFSTVFGGAFLFSKLYSKRAVYYSFIIAPVSLYLSYKYKLHSLNQIKTKLGIINDVDTKDLIDFVECVNYTKIDDESLRQQEKLNKH